MKRVMMLIFVLALQFMLSAQAAPEEFLVSYTDELELDSALKCYENHGTELRSICEKMIESHIYMIVISQHQDDTQKVDVLQKDFRNSEYKQTDILEFNVLKKYSVDGCCEDEHSIVKSFELSNDAIIIPFDNYYHRLDFFNTIENGLYYISCQCCSEASLEERLEKHLDNQYWDRVWNYGVEYQLIELENGFIYYRWLI